MKLESMLFNYLKDTDEYLGLTCGCPGAGVGFIAKEEIAKIEEEELLLINEFLYKKYIIVYNCK